MEPEKEQQYTDLLSDQFSSYYSKIINTNSRDATHVLDGLLNNDTDLNIE